MTNSTAADAEHELREIGAEFGCECLQGERPDAYALRLLAYVSEMAAEVRAVEDRGRHLISSADQSQ